MRTSALPSGSVESPVACRRKVGAANVRVRAQPERVRASWRRLGDRFWNGRLCRGPRSRASPASRAPWEWSAKGPGMVTAQESLVKYRTQADSEQVLRRKDAKNSEGRVQRECEISATEREGRDGVRLGSELAPEQQASWTALPVIMDFNVGGVRGDTRAPGATHKTRRRGRVTPRKWVM